MCSREGLMGKKWREVGIAFSGMEDVLAMGTIKGARSVLDALHGKQSCDLEY